MYPPVIKEQVYLLENSQNLSLLIFNVVCVHFRSIEYSFGLIPVAQLHKETKPKEVEFFVVVVEYRITYFTFEREY